MDQENIDINKQVEMHDQDYDDYDLKAELGSKRRKLRRLAPLGDEEEDYGSSSKATNPAKGEQHKVI